MSFWALAPSFGCAAKFLRFPGSIWRESKCRDWAWQEGSSRFVVERCAWMCKKEVRKQGRIKQKKQNETPRPPRTRDDGWQRKKVGAKNQGRMSLSALAPSFNCAAKFLTLPGSIWRESKSCDWAWQEVSNRFAVESCASMCKKEARK